jgi:hypothetical protein
VIDTLITIVRDGELDEQLGAADKGIDEASSCLIELSIAGFCPTSLNVI